MKKLSYILFVIALAACNNENKSSAESALKDKPVEPGKQENSSQPSTAATGCGSLIMFHKGAVIEGKSYDANGKSTYSQSTTVVDVRDEGGVTVAESTGKLMPSGRSMTLVYKCDGQNLYMDMNSMLGNFKSADSMKISGDPISFPINVSEGQTLPEASLSMAMPKGMNMKMIYSNRTVGPKQKITTPAGSWDCFKISTDIRSEMTGLDEKTKAIMDAVQAKTKMTMVMWYAPGFGLVGSEMYSNGKLQSRSEITGFKE